MNVTPVSRRFAIAAAGIAAVTLAAPQVWAQEVGAAAAVRPSSTGTPPGGSLRELASGTRIVSDERIQTTGSGSLQVMFLDKSTLTIGPNSDLVIDQFVYNPAQGSGEFGVRLAGGALRFVGGQISHRDGATIETPVATIGIRGGAAVVAHDRVCEQLAANQQQVGECTKVVCTGGQCQVSSSFGSNLSLGLNEAIEIGVSGQVQFDVSSVNLNEFVGGGSGSIQKQDGGSSAQATGFDNNFGDEFQQLQEPIAPPAPSPN